METLLGLVFRVTTIKVKLSEAENYKNGVCSVSPAVFIRPNLLCDIPDWTPCLGLYFGTLPLRSRSKGLSRSLSLHQICQTASVYTFYGNIPWVYINCRFCTFLAWWSTPTIPFKSPQVNYWYNLQCNLKSFLTCPLLDLCVFDSSCWHLT